MIFLSFGAGIQSSVMLMLALDGVIDRPDHVIFADTGWEGERTIKHVEWTKRQCGKVGIPFHMVSNGNIRDDAVRSSISENELGHKGGRWAAMPWYVDVNGNQGRAKRQCTQEYKIKPIRRKQRELLGYKPRQRIPVDACQVMIGISTDEARRASPSRDKWVDNIFPLIDPLKMSRGDCQAWWNERYPHISLSRSSCLGCPNKNNSEWREMKLNHPEEWLDVVELDAIIRKRTGMLHDCYLHRSLRPLDEVPFGEGQLLFDFEDELYCAGGCGL